MVNITDTGKNLKELIKIAGLTVQEVATRLYVTEQAVYRWCNGKTLPSIDNLVELSKLIDVKIEDILVEERE